MLTEEAEIPFPESRFEIEAYSDEDAYTIFETMNDRGLSLSLPEMLKGYVLANIRHGGRLFVPAPGLRSFAEMARDRGYRTAAFVSAPPLASTTGIAAGSGA